MLVGGATLWAHQTLLTADGWGGIVEDVISEEEVTDAISVVLVDRLSESLGVRELVAENLPGPDILAGALTTAVQDRITDTVGQFAQTDAFQEAFVNVNKAAYDAALTAIRGGDTDALTSQAGILSLNIFPLLEGLLDSLQDAGIIDESRRVSPISAPTKPRTRRSRWRRPCSGVTSPMTWARSCSSTRSTSIWCRRSCAGSTSSPIVLLVAWALFTGLALWLSRKRVRMVLWLSGGAIAALLAGRFLARLLLEAVTRRQPELEARVVVSAIIDAAVDSLMWFTFVLMLVALIVAIGSVVYERRDRLERASMESPPRTIGRWVKDNAVPILMVGIGIIGVIALWSIGGAGIAMLSAAAMLLLVIAVKVMSDQADENGTSTEG